MSCDFSARLELSKSFDGVQIFLACEGRRGCPPSVVCLAVLYRVQRGSVCLQRLAVPEEDGNIVCFLLQAQDAICSPRKWPVAVVQTTNMQPDPGLLAAPPPRLSVASSALTAGHRSAIPIENLKRSVSSAPAAGLADQETGYSTPSRGR